MEIPRCRNEKGGGCVRSDVKLTGETEDAWVFQCFTCKCVNVISKDGVRDKSKFERAKEEREREAAFVRLKDSRRKFYTAR